MPDDEPNLDEFEPGPTMQLCFTARSGKEYCLNVPTWEWHPYIPPLARPVDQSQWDLPVFLSEHRTGTDTPRPVPWFRDLAAIAAAWGAVGGIRAEGVADELRAGLKQAAEQIVAREMPDATVNFPG